MAVYIAAHKACEMPAAAGYVPLQVGAALSDPLPYTRDNSGDHISEKNPTHCELTGLYWVWKNTHDDVKGLVHYRRLFTEHGRMLSDTRIRALLADNDAIVARTEYLRESAAEEFVLHSGRARDLMLLREAVAAVDDTVLPAYDRVMAGNRLSLFNMLIARREWFDSYCAWLFAVLDAMEPHVDMTDYTPYERRLYGFLAERLLNVWIDHTGARVHRARVVNTERRPIDTLRLALRRIKNRLIFAIHR